MPRTLVDVRAVGLLARLLALLLLAVSGGRGLALARRLLRRGGLSLGRRLRRGRSGGLAGGGSGLYPGQPTRPIS